MTDLEALRLKLEQYGSARDRATDREPRTVTISDDEALLLSTFIKAVTQIQTDLVVASMEDGWQATQE